MRAAQEQEIKHELARVLSVQNIERVRQDELRRGIEEQQRKMSERMKKGEYSVSENLMFGHFVDVSLRAIEGAEENIMKMEPEINEIRQRLVLASKEKKIVEKLKERKQEEYYRHINWEIAKESDDINQKIYMRNLREQ